MKVEIPKCPECGRWLYISSDASEEKRVDIAPTMFIYWTCDCGMADAWPLNVIINGDQYVVIPPHKMHNRSDE